MKTAASNVAVALNGLKSTMGQLPCPRGLMGLLLLAKATAAGKAAGMLWLTDVLEVSDRELLPLVENWERLGMVQRKRSGSLRLTPSGMGVMTVFGQRLVALADGVEEGRR